jgi:hypothetical protein
LSGKFLPGDTVIVRASNGELKIDRKAGPPKVDAEAQPSHAN